MSKDQTTEQKKPKDKLEKRHRNDRKTFRMTENELAAFLANCEAANLKGGDYFRVRCCSAKPIRKSNVRKSDEILLAKILGQLGKWGSNLNQIAHAMNIARKEPTYSSDYAAKRLDQYEKDLTAMRSSIADIETKIQKALLS